MPCSRIARPSSSRSATISTEAWMAAEKRRPQRVAADIRHTLARMLARDVADPRVTDVVVASVVLTADLRIATIGWRLLQRTTEDANKKRHEGHERLAPL